MKLLQAVLALCTALALAICGCGGGSSSTSNAAQESTSAEEGAAEPPPIEPVGELEGAEPKVKPLSGPLPKRLVIRDLRTGNGREARDGRKVTIQFSAIHFNGKPFESSWEFGNPFRFELGAGKVSPAWERGLPGMKVGGRRELLVPWKVIASTGISPDGPHDGQVYVIDLLGVS